MRFQILLPLLLTLLALVSLSSKNERDSLRLHFAKIPDLLKVDSRVYELNSGESSMESLSLKAQRYRIELWEKVTISILISLLLLLLINVTPTRAIPISFFVGVSTFLLLDFLLTREVKKDREALERELPTVLELLTLAIGAGQPPLSAIIYVTERSTGKFHNQLKLLIAEVRSGYSLQTALDRLGVRTQSSMVRQFVDATVSALIRGTPLADVLQRQVFEVRNLFYRQVLERSGKAEISMMVPIVFLILPVSILFALWPSLSHLNLIAG